MCIRDRIYSESFPFVGPLAGNYPISSVGWVEAVSGAPSALYQTSGSDGAVFAYYGTPATTVYYTTTTTDTNQAGLPFPNINLGSYGNPSSLNFSVDIAPSSSSSNVTAYLAVQEMCIRDRCNHWFRGVPQFVFANNWHWHC